MNACTLPPGRRCLPEYQASIWAPLTLVVVCAHRSVSISDPSRMTYAHPCSATCRSASCRSGAPGREDPPALGDVAVAGGPRHPEPGGQERDVLVLAEPHQHHQCLPGAAELAHRAAPPGTPPAPLGAQQPSHLGDQFLWHVEHGTIGDHVESSPWRRILW
jgi:hypothetical protein